MRIFMNPFICMVVMILMHKLHMQVINSVAGLYNSVSPMRIFMNPVIRVVVMILMYKLHMQVINSVAGLYNGVSVLPIYARTVPRYRMHEERYCVFKRGEVREL